MLKILCFGDSITFGEKDTEAGGWADRLKRDYFNQFVNEPIQQTCLYNLGVGGETTDGLKNRFEVEFNSRILKGQPSNVIFAYGSNDIVIHKNKNIVPEEYFVRNLKACIDHAKSNGSQVILLSLLPIASAIEGKVNQHGKLRFESDVVKYNLILNKLAKEYCCEFLDSHSHFIQQESTLLLDNDGVPPNSQGHQMLYQLIQKKLISIGTKQ